MASLALLVIKCHLVLHAGKSAGMILRQINAEALADAQTLHMEQTCDLLQACSLSTAAQPATPTRGAAVDPSGSPHSQLPARQASVQLTPQLLLQKW